jgi:hypothetical protein
MSVWMLTPTLTGRYRQPLVDCVFLAHPRSEGVGSALVLLVGKGECLPDQSSAIGDFLKTNLSAPGDWLVVAGPLEGTGGLSGFRVKLPTAGPLLLQVGTTVTPFGNRLLEKEVDAWLKRIVDASVSPSPPIDFTLDPLPSANRTDPLALMTRWLLAAVQRFSVPLDEARSKNASEALEWMIRQELVLVDDGNPERRPLGGTLFRRERMISDSSWK